MFQRLGVHPQMIIIRHSHLVSALSFRETWDGLAHWHYVMLMLCYVVGVTYKRHLVFPLQKLYLPAKIAMWIIYLLTVLPSLQLIACAPPGTFKSSS